MCEPELRCFQATEDPIHDTRAQLAPERGETYNMKYLAILALTVAALGLGACAKHDDHQTSTTAHTSATSSYSK